MTENQLYCRIKKCVWNDDGECMIHCEGQLIAPGVNCEFEEWDD